MTNLQIAELLRNVASCYQLKDQVKNKFKIIAYERAADAIEHATSELKDLWDDGKLEDVAGIGPSIAKHLDEIFRTGKSAHFEELMKDVSETDKYGRLLRYVWLGDQMVNETLVKEGFAQVSTFPPDVKYKEKFLEVQKFARENKIGLWGKCK